jgi:hydrogenase nickel incorporation protein HypA/HybF
MHELSVATSIVKTAEAEVKKINGESVSAIYLEIGRLSGVEISSLEFVWKPCVDNSALKNAQLFISQPEGRAQCAECNNEFSIEHYFDSCPACGSPFKKIVSGRELKIKKLIIN